MPSLARAARLAVLLALTSALPAQAAVGYAGKPIESGGYSVPARVQGRNVELATPAGFQPRFWPGVNLGSTVPGTLPGELAATRADYDRWLVGMGRLGARVVRVYTILRPQFYEALAAYDASHPGAPIYLIQGVWIPEEEFLQSQDAYTPAVTDGFKAELANAVAVIHGAARLPARPGHASGSFRADVSRFTLAFSIGVEWDPGATKATDDKHPDQPPFEGRFFHSQPGSTAMESWIASMLDWTAQQDAARGWSRPLTFTNWVTTDPLHHPDEPLPQEDEVSIDATHVSATAAWPGGFFASYHAYPYYPDFLRLQPSYQRGDPYANYLAELRAHHGDQALMITEFGVPSSLGIAHLGPLGRNQGDLSERQQGAIDASLLRDIHDGGFAGGIAFEWIDEWFKFTWNTIDYEQPGDRRQLWRNPLTNEEHFGLVAAEPGRRDRVVLDGSDNEWRGNGSRRLARGVRATSDAEYLYLLLDHAPHGASTISFDVRPGGGPDVEVKLGPGRRAQLLQAGSTDAVASQYGLPRSAWDPPRQVISRRPLQTVDVSHLPWGSARSDDRNLVDGRGRVLELRIPWSMLTFSDPSSHLVYVPQPDGTITTQRVGKIGIAIDADGKVTRTRPFAWRDWNSVSWHERDKAGWPALQRAFAQLSAAP